MIDFTIETDIARTPADVFDYVTDPERLSTWQTNTVSAELEGTARSSSAAGCARCTGRAGGTSSRSSR